MIDKDDEQEKEWIDIDEQIMKNIRPHAGHFSWETDSEVAEYGVLKEFKDALALNGRLFFTEERHRGRDNDPPDCEAIAQNGECIGIEITELVDGPSAAAARQGGYYEWKNWTGALIPQLQKLLRRKDSPAYLKGGPYSQYVLVIFSDEPWLERDYVENSLEEHVFPSTSLITRAFLLLSYDPFVKKYPCYELRIALGD